MQAQASQAAQAAQAAQASPSLPDVPAPPGTPQPGTQVIVGPEGRIVIPGGSSPSALYEAARNQRSELREQLDELQGQRRSIIREMQQQGTSDPSRAGLEQRLAQVDQRIAAVDRQLAAADEAVARLASVPGAIVRTPPVREPGPPEEFWVISGLILVPSAFILSIAYARRIWKRSSAAVAAIPQEVYDRFTRVEQAIDSVAVEVERIGEGQRYLTRVLAERQLGAGPVQPVEVKQREGERVAREE